MSNDGYSPSHVANFFLSRGAEAGVTISPMKLLKLVYIGYGWVLAVLDRSLLIFLKERVYA